MNDKNRVFEHLRQTIPRLAADFVPKRRLHELGADSIDLVELLVVIDSDFGVRLKQEEFQQLATVDDLLQLIIDRSPQHAL